MQSRPRRSSSAAALVATAALATAALALSACTSSHRTVGAVAGSPTGSAPAAAPSASSGVIGTPAGSVATSAAPPATSAAASSAPEPASSPAAPVAVSPTPAAPTLAATPTPAAHPPSPSATSATAQPAFVETSAIVTAAELGGSWHAGCPVGPTQLRLLTMSYWGFDNAPHVGTMVVNTAVVTSVFTAFKRLYAEHFPIRSMKPTADFGGSDPKSMDADNTSGFNCRYAVAPGKPTWSVHAYGEAIDVDTVENPYLEGGTVMPAAGVAYVKRSPYRPGMAIPGGELVDAFAAVGWLWGGRWTGSPDYQHFSLTGG